MSAPQREASSVLIPAGDVTLVGVLELPLQPAGVVVFSHGSGSGRLSPRNRFVAAQLRRAGLATLLLDLLTSHGGPGLRDALRYRSAYRAVGIRRALCANLRTFARTAGRSIRCKHRCRRGTSGSGGVVRRRACGRVSRGGRPNLTGGDLLEQVKAPTLLIVGELDYQVIALNESARDTLTHCHRELVIVPGATHLFEEPGALEEVAAPRGTVVHSSYDFNSNPTRPRASVIGVDLQ